MIAELIDLAKRQCIPNPSPSEKLPVHYLIDLDGEGAILGISPAIGSTTEKDGEPELGKLMECPVYFPLTIGKKGEIQAAGGGGKSVAEAGHGDTKEVFCTNIKTPNGKPPKLEIMQPPATHAAVDSNDEEEDTEDTQDNEDHADEGEDEDTQNRKAKNYARHTRWINLLNKFCDSVGANREMAKSLRKFIQRKPRLDAGMLKHFSLPDPEGKAASVPDDTPKLEEARKKANADASKAKNTQLKIIAKARFSFRINGRVLLNDATFKKWWKETYEAERLRILQKLPTGTDGYEDGADASSHHLTPVFPHIPSIPNGGMYCPLASFDKATTKSYGLGKHTFSLSLRSSEWAAGALRRLIQDERSHCKLGKKLVAVFWAVPMRTSGQPVPLDFASILNEPDALQVRNFFNNIHGHATATPEAGQFYCAILSSPKSRITVRSWITETLGHVTEQAANYFKAVSLPNVLRSGELSASTLSELAEVTIPPKCDNVPSSALYGRIFETALFGSRLPHRLLEAAINRQSLELAKGKSEDDKGDFESRLRARTALIKLYFHSNQKDKDKPMNEHNHDKQDHPAYLCGRVLALLDKIHDAAHSKSTASSPAGRYYGSASSTPALVFPRLCKLARIHLEKIDNRGRAYNLDLALAGLISQFNEVAKWPRTLSLEDQGRFAIGFYYERALKSSRSQNEESQPAPDEESEPEFNQE